MPKTKAEIRAIGADSFLYLVNGVDASREPVKAYVELMANKESYGLTGKLGDDFLDKMMRSCGMDDWVRIRFYEAEYYLCMIQGNSDYLTNFRYAVNETVQRLPKGRKARHLLDVIANVRDERQARKSLGLVMPSIVAALVERQQRVDDCAKRNKVEI